MLARRTACAVAVIGLGLLATPAPGQGTVVPPRDLAEPTLDRTLPGHRWTHEGEWWIGYHIAIGNHGTQVFTQYGLNDTAAALLSVHDPGFLATPAWEWWTDPEDPSMVDSAERADVHVAVTQTETGVPNERVVRIAKYTSAGFDWVYTYPHLTAGRAVVGTSADGQVIVAAVGNPLSGLNDVLVFTPEEPTPVGRFVLPGGTLWNFDLAADGRRAVFGVHMTVIVLDLESGAYLYDVEHPFSMSNIGMGISGDGSVFATGAWHSLRVYEWIGDQYQLDWSLPRASGLRAIDVSEDSSTVVYGIGFQYPSTRIIVESADIASRTVTRSEDISSTGEYQNSVMDVAVSADGTVSAAACMGDAPDVVEEVRVYHKHRDRPVHTLNLPGSAFAVDVSPDGRWVAAASKAVHGNELGHGGRVDLLHLGGLDLALDGTPSIGTSVTFTVYGTPGAPARLLDSTGLAPTPLVLPGIGTLYLDPAALSVTTIGRIRAHGSACTELAIPNDPALVGVSHYFQGRTHRPDRLTDYWLVVTFLP